jgi:hypothetical protein
MVGVVLALLLVLTRSASATEFAILLSRHPDAGDAQEVVKNPLYMPNPNTNENPLASMRSFVFDPNEIWAAGGNQPVTFRFDLGDSLPSDLPPLPPNAIPFSIELLDSNNVAIHQLSAPLSIYGDFDSGVTGQLEFGYLESSSGTAAWTVIGTKMVVANSDLLCGTTNHLSTFYLAPVPEPSTLVLGAIGLGLLAAHRLRRGRVLSR